MYADIRDRIVHINLACTCGIGILADLFIFKKKKNFLLIFGTGSVGEGGRGRRGEESKGGGGFSSKDAET